MQTFTLIRPVGKPLAFSAPVVSMVRHLAAGVSLSPLETYRALKAGEPIPARNGVIRLGRPPLTPRASP